MKKLLSYLLLHYILDDQWFYNTKALKISLKKECHVKNFEFN